MAKCFITGIEIPLETSFILDIKAANKVIYELREQLRALEGLIKQLGIKDERTIYDPKKGETYSYYYRRLVCESAATMLAKRFPEKCLFITWIEFKKRKSAIRNNSVQ